MRIEQVTATVWRWEDIPPTRYTSAVASTEAGTTEMALIRIVTDDGIEGNAFLGSALGSARRDLGPAMEAFKPLLMGEDPLARERIWQAMMHRGRGQLLRALGAFDVALWDLAGKAAGVPIHRLLGSYRSSVPAYASSAVLDSPEAYAAEAVRCRDEGWAAYKIHPPADPDLDITICRTVREAVGHDYRLMLDSTWSYDYPAALRVGLAVQELGFYWYEDPLAHDDLHHYVQLKQHLDIPIMATEQPVAGPTAYAPWVLAPATDYLRGDVAVKGGLTSCLKTAHTAESFRMNYEIHHGGNSLNNVANLHLIMAIANSEYFEVLLPDEVQKHGLVDDIVVGPDGLVHAFDDPGLGATIDVDLIDDNTVEIVS